MNFQVPGCLITCLALLLTSCTQTPPGKPTEVRETGQRPATAEQTIAAISIGTLEPVGRDYGCWLSRQEGPHDGPAIFYVALAPDAIRMNINGRERQLSPMTAPGSITKYKVDNFTVTVEWGPMRQHEGACGTWESCSKARITVRDDQFETSIPAKGQCGCG